HGGFQHRLKVNIKWIEAEALEEPSGAGLLDGADGILVPGGFGNRGTRGMMRAAQVARERHIPYFGICYGFQWATVEYARHVAGLRTLAARELRGYGRAARPSGVSRRAVPTRVQVEADAATSALCGIRARLLSAQSCTRPRAGARRRVARVGRAGRAGSIPTH